MQRLFENRTYRTLSRGGDLVGFCVTVKETNLFIRARADLSDEAYRAVMDVRNTIEQYTRSRPQFQTSLAPIAEDPYAAPIIKVMIRDSNLAGVGPMAGVAGAIAEFVARRLQAASGEVIVENGGDVFLISADTRVVALYAEKKGPNVGIEIGAARQGIGICSSSARIGRSLSLGESDLATVVAGSGALADAAATALGNRVKKATDIESALTGITGIPGIIGAVVISVGKIGAAGDVRIVALGP